MGSPNSKRARRRQRARNDVNPNLVYWMGRWMVRQYTVREIDLGNGVTCVMENETWHEPHIQAQIDAMHGSS